MFPAVSHGVPPRRNGPVMSFQGPLVRHNALSVGSGSLSRQDGTPRIEFKGKMLQIAGSRS